mmetsp:Transcript_25247/g.59908  ORF Transcript_25247/g.59908 Transcript_25247/m.59908 type:complete len:619 (-) Transcript_25247:570-2426(-)|eukprot:3830469-Rhodomonas_salina.1
MHTCFATPRCVVAALLSFALVLAIFNFPAISIFAQLGNVPATDGGLARVATGSPRRRLTDTSQFDKSSIFEATTSYVPGLPTNFSIADVILRYDPANRLGHLFTEEAYIAALPEFLEVYDRRPIKNNAGGMGIHHLFGLFYSAKVANPLVVLESGVWKGLTTWILRQAAPSAKIICFDPTDMTAGWHRTLNVERVMGSKFLDISYYNFSVLSPDEKARTFVLIDDHHAHLPRLEALYSAGFTNLWAVFDDNWPPGKGDCTSVKQLMDPTGSPLKDHPYTMGNLDDPVTFKTRFGKTSRTISVKQHRESALRFRKLIDCYIEVPPLAEIPYWQKLYPKAITDQITAKPLFSRQSFAASFPGHHIDWNTQLYVNFGVAYMQGFMHVPQSPHSTTTVQSRTSSARIIAIDIGANCGNSFELMQIKVPLLRSNDVEWFLWEANPKLLEVYLFDLAKSDPRISLMPYAAWTHNSTLKFTLTKGQEHLSPAAWKQSFPCSSDPRKRNPAGASTLINYKHDNAGEKIDVQAISFVDWFKKLGIKPGDQVYVKMDIEGAEFEIVPALHAAGAFCNISWFAVEWHARFHSCGQHCGMAKKLPSLFQECPAHAGKSSAELARILPTWH